MVTLTGDNLTIADVHRVAVEREPVEIDGAAVERIRGAHERVQSWGEDRKPMYGVNTGFGELVHVTIGPEFKSDLQVKLLRSHAAAAGPHFPEPVVRAIMVARLNCFAKGFAGVSPDLAKLLAAMLNAGIHPVIPEQGSLGASGDLAPLAHMGLPLIGESRVTTGGEPRPAAEALAEHGLQPVSLGFKEGLALINGTSAMTGLAALTLIEAQRLLELEVFLTSIFVQCLHGSTGAYQPRGHELKNHPGQMAIAERLRALLDGSGLTRDHDELMGEIEGHLNGDGSAVVDTGVFIQHAYTLRCVPQILGPVIDTLSFCTTVVERELNSCNDNPLIFDTAAEAFHGGNFHGQYVAMACDYLAIALTEIGVLAERQLNRIVDPHINGDLPDFLALELSGLSCGYAGAQYLATSIASENLDLAAPSSVKTIPSNGQNQDVVSMGLNAARRCRRLIDNVGRQLGVYAAACYQASHLRGIDLLSPSTRPFIETLDREVGGPYDDQGPIDELLAAVRDFLLEGEGMRLAREQATLPGIGGEAVATLP